MMYHPYPKYSTHLSIVLAPSVLLMSRTSGSHYVTFGYKTGVRVAIPSLKSSNFFLAPLEVFAGPTAACL